MSLEEGRGSTNYSAFDINQFRADSLINRTRLENESEKRLVKAWPSILWTAIMLIVGVAALVLATYVDDLDFLKPFNAGPYIFLQVAGISSVLAVISRYLVIGVTSNTFPPRFLCVPC